MSTAAEIARFKEDGTYATKKYRDIMGKYRDFFSDMFTFDIGCFFYERVLPCGRVVLLSDRIDILELALETEAYSDSCFLTKCSNFRSGGTFSKRVPGTRHALWRCALERDYNISTAFAFSSQFSSYSQIVGWDFYYPKEKKSFLEIQNTILMNYASNLRGIKACFDQFEQEVFSIIENKDLYRLNLKDIKRENYDTQKFQLDDGNDAVRKSILRCGIISEKDLMLERINFTFQETKVLGYYLQGMSVKEIGKKMNRSHKTVEEHVSMIKTKLGVKKKSEVVALLLKCIYWVCMASPIFKIPYKLIATSSIGGVLELYDLYIFGLLAPTISQFFFPMENKLISVLSGYLVFAIGFFFRPLGSIFFGHIGDRFGRRTSLYSCLLLMAIATLLIGIMPTYKSIGVLAPCLIVFARVLQGFSAGGEFSGGLLFIVEHTAEKHRGFTAGIGLAGNTTGIFLSSVSALIFTLPSMPGWAWRIPFLIGFVIALIGLYIRRYLPETPAFIEMKRQGEIEKIPLLQGVKYFYKKMIMGIFIIVVSGVIYYINIIALPPLFVKLFSISKTLSQLGNTIGLFVMIIMLPIFGFYADKIGKDVLASISIILLFFITMFGIYFLYIKTSPHTIYVLLYQIFACMILAMNMVAVDIFLIESFKRNIRYSCFGVSHDTGLAIAGLSPFLLTLLIHHHNYFVLSMSIVILSILALFSIYKIPRLSITNSSRLQN